MLLEKLLKEFNVDVNTFNSVDSERFDQYFERILIKKNTFLIKEGELEKYSYFIFNGIARCWTLNHNGEEQTFWFCKEGTFSLSNISFTLREKSTFNVQALTNCEIYKIDQDHAAKLYHAIPGLKAVFEGLTARLLDKLLTRNINLIKYSPEQYYLQMMAEFGNAFNDIPLKDIASYLGITPQALSRIRKRIF
ncbi:Crp/Fnr family transcriptional regulator [Chryseobacterium tructae]|uniref:Crp/Fnr family transcriptional regulator n=1 Tax=Chryseobacterium tructae TaxID=1037380 RepID=A0ABV7XXR2_9FLAO|nr:Crp/Fnr family transcriptional regulator [Chryseobacterium tructae]MDN3693093.1 Crp/Fnr family transcriptional regulator [Chryseobacterium tructae]